MNEKASIFAFASSYSFLFSFLMLAILINPLSFEATNIVIIFISILGSASFGIGVYTFTNFLYVVLSPQQEKVEEESTEEEPPCDCPPRR